MKLTTITHVSVDGVMQGLGGADEDHSGGFERGGWALPLFGDEAAKFLDEVFQRADAFLFGHRTSEIFAGSSGSWGANPSNNPISVALNTDAQVRGIDHAHRPAMGGHDRSLRRRRGRRRRAESQAREASCKCTAAATWSAGSSRTTWSTRSPCSPLVVVGQGTRLFPGTGRALALELVDSRATPSGVAIQVYRPPGARSTQRPPPTTTRPTVTRPSQRLAA